MNPQIKQEWLDELKLHKQARFQLKNCEGNMCCLGVLCEVAQRHGIGHWSNAQQFLDMHHFDSEYEGLIDAVQQWSGIDDRVGSLPISVLDRDDMQTTLAILNDTGCTFEQIADVIKYFF